MSQQMQELKEPLISIDTKENNLRVLEAYRSKHEADPNEEPKSQADENQDGENIQQDVVEPEIENLSVEAKLALKAEEARLKRLEIVNYAEIASSVCQSQEAPEKQFYLQATSVSKIPTVKILKTCVLKSNPSIFAALVEASSFYRDEQEPGNEIEIREMIPFEDYEKLCRLRLRNYIQIIQMVLKIDQKPEMYQECKTKLFQVKALMKYLNLQGYDKLFDKLRENQPIDDDDEDEKKNEEAKEEGEEAEENEENQASDDYGDEDNGEEDSDEEYINFFKSSKLYHGYRGGVRDELMREEDKWVLRAEWLKNILENLKSNRTLISWVPWIKAKMEQLVDLDVDVKTGTNEPSTQVFYLLKFLEEQFRTKDHENEYSNDQRVYIDQQTIYPAIQSDASEINTDNYYIFKAWTTIRSKLCLRIKRREEQTNYFLNVYQKKAFGVEKLYEKRINAKNLSFNYPEMVFHPNGSFLYFKTFTINQAYEFVFALEAQNKDPLLLKNGGTFIGFQDKYLYTSLKNRVYEYDLHDFNKIKFVDINYGKSQEEGQIDATDLQHFGRYKEGFYYIKPKEGTDQITFEIRLKNDLYSLDSSEKMGPNSNPQFALNEKGDKLLIAFWKESTMIFAKYSAEAKDVKKVFKKEGPHLDPIKTKFTYDKDKLDIKIIPTSSDFVILARPQKQGAKTVYIFWNETPITEVETENFEDLQFNFNEKGQIQAIYIMDSQESYLTNTMKYKICEEIEKPQEKKKEWTWRTVQYQILNTQVNCCFPYLYYIYNHDQVYMKDLSKPNNKGYFYMNNFLGIEKGLRPLAVYGFQYSDKMTLWVPTINKNYTNNDFIMRLHVIKSYKYETNRLRFDGFIRYRIFACNEELLVVLQSWLSPYFNKQGNIAKDIRVNSKHNVFSIEKWVDNKCESRVMVTNFAKPVNPDINFTREGAEMSHRQFGQWIFILQKRQEITLFQHEMRYQFRFETFKELESSWTYVEDDTTNEIYDILIDTVISDRVDLYIMYSNATLKKFSAPITYQDVATLQFVEAPYTLSVDQLFKGKGEKQAGGGGKDSAASSKKTNIYEQQAVDVFIANQMFYSIHGQIDFRAVVPGVSEQTGLLIDPSNIHYNSNSNPYAKLTFSANEAKVIQVLIDTEDRAPKVVCMPLLNSRQIPQFQQNQFIHPVVPILDKEKGLTSVFTITNEQRYQTYMDPTHQKWRTKLMRTIKHLQPGLIIKYFNGIEKKLHFADFGEEFTEVIRFKQSLNGKFLVIAGVRKGPLNDPFYEASVQKQEQHEGLFLYELTSTTVTLIKAFLFARKDKAHISKEVFIKMNEPKSKIREYVQPELAGLQVGEYSNAYNEEDGKYMYQSYEDDIDFDEYDEELQKATKYIKSLIVPPKNRDSLMSRKSQVLQEEPRPRLHLPSQDEEALDHTTGNEFEIADLEKKELTGLTGLELLFEDFDIPYMEDKPEQAYQIDAEYRDAHLIKEIIIPKKIDESKVESKKSLKTAINAEQYEDTERNSADGEANQEEQQENEEEQEEEHDEDRPVKVFDDEERVKINRIHENMHLEVNEQGHMFLIDRIHNKLYFFYSVLGEYKIAKLKFEPLFKITSADSSQNYLVVRSNTQYRVYQIDEVLNSRKQNSKFANDTYIFFQKNVERQSRVPDEIPMIYDSKEMENKNVDEAIVGIDKYEYSIEDCKVYQNFVLVRAIDNQGLCFLRVIDVKKNLNVFYIEGEKIMISGDKQYVWLQERNEVYDIAHGLSTLFIWPGDQISTPAFLHCDNFNVSEDRTIMSTMGYLQLAFNYISFLIDNQIGSGFDIGSNYIISKQPLFEYMYYKIGNAYSILNRIFHYDVHEIHFEDPENHEGKSKEEIDKYMSDLQAQQLKALSYLLGFFTNRFSTELNNTSHLTNFFFSYYSLQRRNDENSGKLIAEDPNYLNIFQKLYSFKDKRIELIEDILHYVVASDVPIAQYVVNSVFFNLLENAHTSQAFQDYLRNITKQTKTMMDVEKFPIKSSDQGFYVNSHNSAILDNQFYSKFKQPSETKKDVEIYYIDLGDLLSTTEKGEKIMEQLSDSKYLPIMDIPFIQYLVMYQYVNVRKPIRDKLLNPFYALLILFTIYADYQINYMDPREGEEITETKSKGFFGFAFWITNTILLVTVLAYFLFREAQQFLVKPAEYFTSFWNVSDLMNIFLCFAVIILDVANAAPYVIRPIASITVIILWIKMFYFLRVYESTSRLIRMIIEIVNDMKNFLIVLIIAVIGFTNGYYILSQGNPPTINEDTKEEEGGYFAGKNIFKAFIYTYRLTLGDFATDEYDGLPTLADTILVWIIFTFASLFVVIVLLNLLIAIMGDTFSRVLENITNLSIREKVMLVSENETLFSRQDLFKSSQYLIIIKEKNLESLQAENWDGQINALKRQVIEKIDKMNTELNAKITDNQRDLKKRFTDQEDKSKRQVSMIEGKITGTVKEDLEGVMTKVNDLFHQFQGQLSKSQGSSSVGISDTQKTVKHLQDKVDSLMNEQAKFSRLVYQHFKIDPNAKKDGEDDE